MLRCWMNYIPVFLCYVCHFSVQLRDPMRFWLPSERMVALVVVHGGRLCRKHQPTWSSAIAISKPLGERRNDWNSGQRRRKNKPKHRPTLLSFRYFYHLYLKYNANWTIENKMMRKNGIDYTQYRRLECLWSHILYLRLSSFSLWCESVDMFIWVLAMLFTYLSVICFQLCYYYVLRRNWMSRSWQDGWQSSERIPVSSPTHPVQRQRRRNWMPGAEPASTLSHRLGRCLLPLGGSAASGHLPSGRQRHLRTRLPRARLSMSSIRRGES